MNENVFEYCKKFIQSKNSPHFAVLIKGGWGVGKTFFIKNMVTELRLDKSDYVYLSLFGLKSIDDINVKIFEAMHPILSSPQMKLAGSILKSALKLGADFKFDFSKGAKDGSVKIGLGDPSLKGIETLRTKRNLIIVDDIERIEKNLSIDEVFGFFQDIIVDSDTKVIFVGNEDKIESEISKHSYASIKEKTIGQEFLIQSNPNDAIEVFIKELSIHKKIEELVKKSLEDIVAAIECKNLRCLRNALWGLNEYSELIIKDIYDDVDKKSFISTYLLLSIQKSLNCINQNDDIHEVLKVYQSYHIRYNCYKERKESEKLDVSFVVLNLPFLNHWSEIIFEGENSRDVLNAYYLKEKDVQKKNKKQSLLFIIINSWREFDDDEFRKNVDELKKEFDQGKYLHPGEILHYANIMLLFSYWKIRPETYQGIEKQIKDVYSKYSVKAIKDFDMLKMGFGGWSFSMDFEPMKKIFDYVEIENGKHFETDLSQAVSQDVDKMSNDNINDFCCNLWRCNGSNKYMRFPFFKYVDVDEFCLKLKELDSHSIEFLLQSLEERYGIYYSNSPAWGESKDDVPNLKKIKSGYMKGRRTVMNSPKNLQAKKNAERLQKIIDHIERTAKVVYIKPRSI